MRTSVRIVLALTGLMLAPSCGEPTVTADLKPGACARRAIVDRVSGAPVRGIEDIAVGGSDLVFLSAYDRWATESAAINRTQPMPQGGLYLLRAKQLGDAGDSIAVDDASAAFKTHDDFHPHGLDVLVDADGRGTLAVINRRYGPEEPGNDEPIETTLEIFTVDGETLTHRMTVRDPLVCRANDVALLNDHSALISRDHQACGDYAAARENILGTLGLYYGEVARFAWTDDPSKAVEAAVVAGGIGFPNGLALDRQKQRLYLAATREKTIHNYAMSGADTDMTLTLTQLSAMPGGPDNVTLLSSGTLFAALYPNLRAAALYRFRWVAQAPSRVVRLRAIVDDPTTSAKEATTNVDAVTTLWDDASGEIFSAASVAAPLGDRIILGSVADDGVAVCPQPSDM